MCFLFYGEFFYGEYVGGVLNMLELQLQFELSKIGAKTRNLIHLYIFAWVSTLPLASYAYRSLSLRFFTILIAKMFNFLEDLIVLLMVLLMVHSLMSSKNEMFQARSAHSR